MQKGTKGTQRNEKLSLYFHIPFCQKICPYCDFTTFGDPHWPEEGYVSALLQELRSQVVRYDLTDYSVLSIFFGGGTPSLLGEESLERIMQEIRELWSSSDTKQLEVTAEANPSDITPTKAAIFRQTGITRVSLGAQSLSSHTLALLGRDHTPGDIRDAAKHLRAVEMPSISLDLIFGVPDQDLSELDKEISAFLELQPHHISTYSLTIERGTPFFKAAATGTLVPLSDEIVREQYERILDRLPQEGGLEQYEVSNFATSGHASLHNQHYWKRGSYLGIGAGAHSFLATTNTRWANRGNPYEYIELQGNGESTEAWRESLTASDEITELIMLGARTSSGVKLSTIKGKMSPSGWTELREKIDHFSEESLIEVREGTLLLTREGLCIADAVIEELVAVL
jgi:oxygen-independent coproporphyrinogen-3 oxidase